MKTVKVMKLPIKDEFKKVNEYQFYCYHTNLIMGIFQNNKLCHESYNVGV
jgi:hypothetical protein